MSNEAARDGAIDTGFGQQAKQPKVAVLLTPARRAEVLTAEAQRQLASLATVVIPEGPTLSAGELPTLLDGAVACLTGWGTPSLSEALLAGCPTLRLVAHTAGSVRNLVPLPAIERGLKVSHAAAMIADSVAEYVVSQALLCCRHLHEIDQAMKTGQDWSDVRRAYPGRLLGSKIVGVVGTGRVGRAVIRLLKVFGCRLLAYDPYLTAEQAEQLGVEMTGLDDLMARSDLVTLHAPVLPETKGMIGATQLAKLRDQAILINAARASLVDEEALYHELVSGRIFAVLDVFTQEPLPLDSRFRALPNVLLSPHAAGHTIDTHLRQGQAMVDEVRRFLAGEALHYEITPAMYSIMA
ncbi:MAG: hydroxyacid dehydrogenase [Ktedonobacteraceae bacterium]|nr:hydroxyacid dehydrogenase [Ktedonobacteraceae bacterium]